MRLAHVCLTLPLVSASAAAELPPTATGVFYVSDFVNDRVVVYGADGSLLRSFSAPGLDGPRGIVVTDDGRIFVASQLTNQVHVFSRQESPLATFGAPELASPTGMAIGPTGELYVSSFSNARVCVFGMDGVYQRMVTAPGFTTPNCVAFDADGNMYAASALAAQIFKWDAAEQFLMSFGAAAPYFLSSPMGIARDESGVLHVAGGASDNILRFATDGTTLGEISHPDLTGPQGVAFDERGHMFSSSFYQDNVVEFDAQGNYVRTITDGALRIPRSIAFENLRTPALGSSYCAAQANSSGQPARITAAGTSVASANEVLLLVDDAPAGKPGIFFYGATQAQVPLGGGFRCVGGTVQRLQPILFTDAAGRTRRELDLSASPLSGDVAPGVTQNFQFWFRDGMGATNLSDGVSVDFR